MTRLHCIHNHDLTAPNAYYQDKHGHKRCRKCHLQKMSAYKKARGPKDTKRRLQPHLYRNWAHTAWNNMSQRDRMIVAIGLRSLPLEQNRAA